jgi:hypothetical protein
MVDQQASKPTMGRAQRCLGDPAHACSVYMDYLFYCIRATSNEGTNTRTHASKHTHTINLTHTSLHCRYRHYVRRHTHIRSGGGIGGGWGWMEISDGDWGMGPSLAKVREQGGKFAKGQGKGDEEDGLWEHAKIAF